MSKAGGIIGIIAGVFGFIAAIITLLFGGLGAAFEADQASTVVGLGWGGVLFSFLAIICAAIALSRPKGAGIALIIVSILGAVLGGTLVAVCMGLSLIGGILALLGAKTPHPSPTEGSDTFASQSEQNKPKKKRIFILVGGACIAVIFLIFIFVGKDTTNTSKETQEDLNTIHPSALRPDGELSEIFNMGSDHTDIQRENKKKEIVGQVVEWILPVYEVSRSGDGYKIQTKTGTGLRGSYVGTFVYITPRNDMERSTIENLKTNDEFHFKGKISGVSLRLLVIRPAIIPQRIKAIPGDTTSPKETATLSSGQKAPQEASQLKQVAFTGKMEAPGTAMGSISNDSGESLMFEMVPDIGHKIFQTCKAGTICKITALIDSNRMITKLLSVESIETIPPAAPTSPPKQVNFTGTVEIFREAGMLWAQIHTGQGEPVFLGGLWEIPDTARECLNKASGTSQLVTAKATLQDNGSIDAKTIECALVEAMQKTPSPASVPTPAPTPQIPSSEPVKTPSPAVSRVKNIDLNKTKNSCPDRMLATPVTEEATFLSFIEEGAYLVELRFTGGVTEIMPVGYDETLKLKKGDKVSVTYQDNQFWDEEGDGSCRILTRILSIKAFSTTQQSPSVQQNPTGIREIMLTTGERDMTPRNGLWVITGNGGEILKLDSKTEIGQKLFAVCGSKRYTCTIKATVDGDGVIQKLLSLESNSPALAALEGKTQGRRLTSQPAAIPQVKPSFDCAKATTPVELAICSDYGLAQLDVALAKVYSIAKTKGDTKGLVAEQKKWIDELNQQCGSASNINQCTRESYTTRIQQLGQYLVPTTAAPKK